MSLLMGFTADLLRDTLLKFFTITGNCAKGNYVKKHDCHVCPTHYTSTGGTASECTKCKDYQYSETGICKNGW